MVSKSNTLTILNHSITFDSATGLAKCSFEWPAHNLAALRDVTTRFEAAIAAFGQPTVPATEAPAPVEAAPAATPAPAPKAPRAPKAAPAPEPTPAPPVAAPAPTPPKPAKPAPVAAPPPAPEPPAGDDLDEGEELPEPPAGDDLDEGEELPGGVGDDLDEGEELPGGVGDDLDEAAPAAGDAPSDKIIAADKVSEVIEALQAAPYTMNSAAAITAWMVKYQNEVPVLKRTTNLAERLPRALALRKIV